MAVFGEVRARLDAFARYADPRRVEPAATSAFTSLLELCEMVVGCCAPEHHHELEVVHAYLTRELERRVDPSSRIASDDYIRGAAERVRSGATSARDHPVQFIRGVELSYPHTHDQRRDWVLFCQVLGECGAPPLLDHLVFAYDPNFEGTAPPTWSEVPLREALSATRTLTMLASPVEDVDFTITLLRFDFEHIEEVRLQDTPPIDEEAEEVVGIMDIVFYRPGDWLRYYPELKRLSIDAPSFLGCPASMALLTESLVWEHLTHLALLSAPAPEVTRLDDFIAALSLGHLRELTLGPLPEDLRAAFDAALPESVLVSHVQERG